jgi:dTDP-4-amino-4,6-dideoxygalactose transaminase
VGATPIFADVDRESQNITVATIRASITPRTRAIIAVHLAGLPCNMDAILAVGKDHGIRVIEDCAQAHGARYKGSPVGSFGDIGTFSFCQDKIISTGGEGGMITLNDDAHWSFAWSFKDHGKDFNAAQRDQQTEGIRWVHESPGTNWRLTEMQSALGRNALRRLDGWVETRRRNAEILKSSFGGLQVLRVPKVPPEYYHSYYKFYAFLETGALKPGWTRDRIVYEMSAAGVPCSAGGCGEIHLEKAFASGKERQARTPVARELAETSLMFLVHPTLSVEDMDCIASSAVRALRVAAR